MFRREMKLLPLMFKQQISRHLMSICRPAILIFPVLTPNREIGIDEEMLKGFDFKRLDDDDYLEEFFEEISATNLASDMLIKRIRESQHHETRLVTAFVKPDVRIV